MINQFVKLALILFLGCIEIPVISQTLFTQTEDLKHKQYEVISDYISKFPDSTQLAIAIINHDSVNFIGVEKVDSQLFSIDNKNSVFEIASITKVFTSTVLSNLILDSILSLNDPIDDILPITLNQSSKSDKSVTFKTLANHTSGISREPEEIKRSYIDSPYLYFNQVKFDDYLENRLVLNTIPGENYLYSNTGFALLGYLLETISHKNYEDLCQGYIFKKYRMDNTTTAFDKVNLQFVNGRGTNGNKLPYWTCNALKGTGGSLSTVSDLSKFIIANFANDPVLNLPIRETFSHKNRNVALGWEIIKISNKTCSLEWHYKDGNTGGSSSIMMMDKTNEIGVVVLSNVSVFHNDQNTVQLAVDLLKSINVQDLTNIPFECKILFLDFALKNGWGTWNESVRNSLSQVENIEQPIIGIWQRASNARTHYGINCETTTFIQDGKFQLDFMGNPEIDIWGYYQVDNNKITFNDLGGNPCTSDGLYSYEIKNDTLSFTLIKDNCQTRESGLSGIWIKDMK